jgi:hypothetical protein
MTHARSIIVQIEAWETYDFYQREVRPGFFPWHFNPFNPRNNVNYTSEESGLPEDFPSKGAFPLNPFFETVPTLSDNKVVLPYQLAYVDRLLSISLRYDHVLYCMDNETHAHPDWGAYWARYIREKAAAVGTAVETTEMWDNWDPTGGAVPEAVRMSEREQPHVLRSSPLNCLRQRDAYTFSDISNNNAQRGETHYRTAHWFWNAVQESGQVWPIHCDKMYGGRRNANWSGSITDGLERFWRNIFAGQAGTRFHRPPSGLGLSLEAQTQIKAMRSLEAEVEIWKMRPAPELLSEREENTSFCLSESGRFYAVVFINPGSCRLDASSIATGRATLRWLEIAGSTWSKPVVIDVSKPLPLVSDQSFRVALLEAAE